VFVITDDSYNAEISFSSFKQILIKKFQVNVIKMSHFQAVGNRIFIKPIGEDGSHLIGLLSSVAYLRHDEDYTDLVSISPTFYKQLLRVQIPKALKGTNN